MKNESRWSSLISKLKKKKYFFFARIYLRVSRVKKSQDLTNYALAVARRTQHGMYERQTQQLQSISALQEMNFGTKLCALNL